MKRGVVVERWYGALLKLLPIEVRREYGSDMLLTFEQRLVERSPWRRPAFVLRESAAVARFGMSERLAQSPGPKEPRKRRMDVLRSNVRAGLRTLQRNPGFTGIAVLILGIGIGLTTAIFSALDAVLLRPAPYVNAHEPVNVERTAGDVSAVVPWPHSHFELVRERGGPFVDVAAHGTGAVTLTGWGEPLRLTAEFVSDNYLSLLGIHPQIGRGFEPGGGDRTVRDREVLLSDQAWRERFGGGEVLGVGVTLNGRTAVVAGVLPAGFHGESGDAEVDPAFRRALLLTFGAAALVMVIVCLNISSLLLVRTQGRDRELAIRGALGASRARLVGQLP